MPSARVLRPTVLGSSWSLVELRSLLDVKYAIGLEGLTAEDERLTVERRDNFVFGAGGHKHSHHVLLVAEHLIEHVRVR